MNLKDQINLDRLPQHIAIIMDGNGRWAKQQGKQRTFGHQNGVNAVREASESAAELGVRYLTLYAFSTENWNRPKYEIDALMQLLVESIDKETPTLNKNNIRLNAIGDIKSLPEKSYNQLLKTIKETAGNDRMTLTLALSYSSRWEITETVKLISSKIENKELNIDDIDQQLISSYLNTSSMPDPELLIRTSGELRISNFLLWQIAYSELYFTPKLWPDFKKEDLYDAIIDYQNRERRFGKTSEQILKNTVE
ncbi:MAG: isoprenyl transferase [Bacteroidetes bacterium HGW-Bacteroidetes-17]|nr:MAG: isoprenyl transferase [Bacteroidetes bacterium HGW-Bacteroidetes-17]